MSRCRLCGRTFRYSHNRGLARLHFVAEHPWVPFVHHQRWLALWRALFIRELYL